MKWLKDILMPPFSERDLVILYISLALPFIETHSVKMYFTELFGEKIWLLGIILWGFLSIYTIKHIKSRQEAEPNEKSFVVKIYYFFLGLLVIRIFPEKMFAFTNSFYENIPLSDLIDFSIITIMLFRGVVWLTAIRTKNLGDKFLTNRMTDDQINKHEIIFLLIVGIAFYFLLRQNNDILTSVLLTNFYASASLYVYLKAIYKPPKPTTFKHHGTY